MVGRLIPKDDVIAETIEAIPPFRLSNEPKESREIPAPPAIPSIPLRA